MYLLAEILCIQVIIEITCLSKSSDCLLGLYLSVLIIIRATSGETLSSGFPTRFDTNWAAQSQKMVRGLKFRI